MQKSFCFTIGPVEKEIIYIEIIFTLFQEKLNTMHLNTKKKENKKSLEEVISAFNYFIATMIVLRKCQLRSPS